MVKRDGDINYIGIRKKSNAFCKGKGMKIGILTFHYAYNYGALFQAVSLFDYLNSLGHEVYMVNYQNQQIAKTYKLYPYKAPNKNIRFYMTLCLRLIMRYLRFRNFVRFIDDNFTLISPQRISELDCIIVGSDQVWNTKLTNGYDSFYWGDIPFKGKIIAYAASMNAVELTDGEKEIASQKIKNFSSISVRETSLLNLLQPLSVKKVISVLDPTMLNDFTYWIGRCKNKKTDKYVLAYPLRDGCTVMKIARDIAKRMSCGVKVIHGSANWNPFTNVYETAGPYEALNLINGASFVVTSSFHGTALSVLLRKQFYTVKCKDGNNVRTESVLNLLGLSNRLLDNEYDIDLNKNVDYDKVDKLLAIEREKSRSYLKNNIYG